MKLEERISAGNDLLRRRIETPGLDIRSIKADHKTWTEYNEEFLRAFFSTDQLSRQYRDSRPIPEMRLDDWAPSPVDEVRGLHDVIHAELQYLKSLLHRLELFDAPADSPRGGFVAPGAALDALQVIGRILAAVHQDVLIVDPYIDLRLFTDFAPLAPAAATVRLLADSHSTKPDALRPGLDRWKTQFGSARPIEVRLSPPRALHDRLIFADSTSVWSISQSLKDLAARSAASAQQLDPDLAGMKVAHYSQIWNSSSPLV